MGKQREDHRAVKKRLKQSTFRPEMTQLERKWAFVSAIQQALAVREIAAVVGLSATRVYEILADRSAEIALPALSVFREMKWSAPETSDYGEIDADLLVE